MGSELLPCPFCASTDLEVSDRFSEDANWCVFCLECKASGGYYDTPKDAIKAWNRRQQPPALPDAVRDATLNSIPIYANEMIDDIVDNHIFLDNGTSTYRVFEDRANKYMREMRDRYEKEVAFWQRYGVVKHLELVEAKAYLATPAPVANAPRDAPTHDGWWAFEGQCIGTKPVTGTYREVLEVFDDRERGLGFYDLDGCGTLNFTPVATLTGRWTRISLPWDGEKEGR